jgi:hypothetical protein
MLRLRVVVRVLGVLYLQVRVWVLCFYLPCVYVTSVYGCVVLQYWSLIIFGYALFEST